MKLRILPVLAIAAALSLAIPAGPIARAETTNMADPSKVSQKLLAQGAEKQKIQDRLAKVWTMGGALPGMSVDRGQPCISGPLQRGIITLAPGTSAAFAYIQPYREPNDWAHINYCGPGAAIELLSHWDRNYPSRVDIDELGSEMNIDPYGGVWVRQMVAPINQRLKQITGQDVHWYRYGEARTLDDFRYMLKTDLVEHGIPLITSLQTGGLPGWGAIDVGHIVAIYGYIRTADGTEYVSYADTAPPLAGHSGFILHTWELNSFWQAVSQNSAQVW